MNTETKFNVGDIVKFKYDRNSEERIILLRVMEISIQCCYTTVQVFYTCRTIQAQRNQKGFTRPPEYTWEVFHGVGGRDGEMGWKKYREDELVKPSKEETEIITGSNE